MWIQIIQITWLSKSDFLDEIATSESKLSRNAFNLCTTALVISPNNDCVLKDSVGLLLVLFFNANKSKIRLNHVAHLLV